MGRGHTNVLEVKNWVPQLFYAEAADSIRQQEGELFANGRTWVSLCAGAHSDGLVALYEGYAYVPFDVEGWSSSYGGQYPNEPIDMIAEDIYDRAADVLGGEDGLLGIAVVAAAIPCETHSILNPGRHRDLQTGKPRQGASGDRARQVDAIQQNYETFLRRLTALREAAATGPCTCGRRGRSGSGSEAGASEAAAASDEGEDDGGGAAVDGHACDDRRDG